MIPGIWTAMYAEMPLHDALGALHELGWRAFEVSTEHLSAIETDADPQRQIEKVLHCLNELDLSAPQAHAHLGADVAAPDSAQREMDINRLRRHTEIAAQLGVRTVVMHPGGKGYCATQADGRRIRELNIEGFRRLGDFAGEHNVNIGIENLIQPGASTPLEILGLLEVIDHSAIGVTVDTSHANAAGLDVAEVVRELRAHLVGTHVSDNNGSGDQHLMPGGGTIDWPSVMSAFREVRYGGLFNLEIPGERHKVPGLRRLKTRFGLEVTEWLLSLSD